MDYLEGFSLDYTQEEVSICSIASFGYFSGAMGIFLGVMLVFLKR